MSDENDKKSGTRKTKGRYDGKSQHKLTHRQTSDILELKVKGYRDSQIAEFTGKTQAAVHQFLQQYDGLLEAVANIESYRNSRLNMLDGIEALLLKSICKSLESDKVTLKDAVFAFDKITNSRRLEQGLATSININQVRFTKVTEETLGDKVIDITPPTGKESDA